MAVPSRPNAGHSIGSGRQRLHEIDYEI